jgi:hypothetical protein
MDFNHKLTIFTAGTILNDTIYIKKNNLNTHYKNLSISANVNLASINSKLSMNRRARFSKAKPCWQSQNGNEFKLPLRLLL